MVLAGLFSALFTCLIGQGINIKFEIHVPKGFAMVEYKVDELSVVTDESIEEVLNKRTSDGWHFDSIQFVVREASKRPSMAFVFFTREASSKS